LAKKKANLLKTTAHQFLLKREVQPAPFISSTVFFCRHFVKS